MSPVEVVESCLNRIEQINPVINAICTLDAERALISARQAEDDLVAGRSISSLHGIPVGIKDITETEGLLTTYGSPLYKDFVPAKDAEIVRRLKDAGAIVLGKTNTPEFATGGITDNELFGKTCNPWNTDLISGGSTGGGAAALAAGMVHLASGTDHGGSLRQPASLCGVVGLRPSVGLVPSEPTNHYWQTMSVAGPMARTASDVALMLDAISGISSIHPLSTEPVQKITAQSVANFAGDNRSYAYISSYCGMGIDHEIDEICREGALALRSSGASVEEIELDLSEGRDIFIKLRGQMMVTSQFEHLGELDFLGENLSGNIRLGLKQSVTDLAEAEIKRGHLLEKLIPLFDRYDAILTPCVPVHAFPISQKYPSSIGGQVLETYIDWLAPTFVMSLFGLPAASVPVGLSSKNMPIGLQIVGKRLNETLVLGTAKLIQDCRPIGTCYEFNQKLAADLN